MTQYITIDDDGDKCYYKDKEMEILHREGGPAIEYANGGKEWYRDGKHHREDGPAAEWPDGSKKEWYWDGKLHREDGPAIEWADGGKRWYLNGKKLSKAKFLRRTQHAKEMTVAEIEKLLGHRVKVVKG
jgi:antitoxin component YwqK of YwqJK toxin-antitoxin module